MNVHTEKIIKSTDRDIAMEGVVVEGGAAAAAAKKDKEAQDKAKAKREEDARAHKEEETRNQKYNEIRRKEEEKEEARKKEEETRKREEETRQKEEETRKKDEDKKRKEEENKKKEEEKRSHAEEKTPLPSPNKGSPVPSPASSMNSSSSSSSTSSGIFSGTSSTSSLVGSSSSSSSPKSAATTSTVLVGISGFPLLSASTVDKTHPESLRWILSDRAALTSFVAFLKSEVSDENIGFYMAVESYRAKFKATQLSHPTYTTVQVAKALEKDAAAIFKQFLQVNNLSSKTVNLPEDVSSRLVKNLRAFHTTGTYTDAAKPENDSRESWPVPELRTPFDEPQETVYKLMETDSLRRFIKSEEGKEAMSKAGVR